MDQLDRASLGHNTFTPEAIALIVRSGEGLLRRTRNLCLGSLIEAGRDQTRIVDLKQVNRVLIQPTGEKTVTHPSSKGPRWPREQIRAARLAPLLPLLQKRRLQIVEEEAGNFTLPAYPGLLIKDRYWRWPERNLAGNAIDFHVQVLGLSFQNAMLHLTAT